MPLTLDERSRIDTVLDSMMEAAPPPPRGIGVNLTAVDRWNTPNEFVDAMKKAWAGKTMWRNVGSDDGDIEVDADGWPLLRDGQVALTRIFDSIDGRYPAGEYQCEFDGDGTITFGGDAKWHEDKPGIVVVTPSAKGIEVRVTASNPADHVRNIKLYQPRGEDSPFVDGFVERINPFTVLRFMDWGRTNHSQIVTWADRPRPDWASYKPGVPLEVMCALCNVVDANGWFCVPHMADDDYVRAMARMIEANLNPHLDAYIEYSNEVWNASFGQAAWCSSVGMAAGLSDKPLEARLLWQARRSDQIFDIFADVLGSDRLVRVLAGQASTPWVLATMLQTGVTCDAIAIAPYFGGGISYEGTVDDVLARAEATIPQQVGEFTAVHKALADRWGVGLIAYEGGQHLRADHAGDTAKIDVSIAANRHPRMGELYRQMYEAWFSNGGGLFMHFSGPCAAAKWFGSWGLVEYQDDDPALSPKWSATMEAMRLD